MSKPFFYRIEAVDFFTLVNGIRSDKALAKFIRQFATDLITRQPNSEYSGQVISEAIECISKKKDAGRIGGKQKASNAKAMLARCYDDASSKTLASKQLVVSSNHLSESEEVKPKDKTLSPSGDEAPVFYPTKKKRKLTGKRLETFEQFWSAFNYKYGRAEAADSWLDIPQLTDAAVQKILSSAKKEADGRPALIQAGKTPKMAQGWISGRRWEDEQPAPPQQEPAISAISAEEAAQLRKLREQYEYER